VGLHAQGVTVSVAPANCDFAGILGQNGPSQLTWSQPGWGLITYSMSEKGKSMQKNVTGTIEGEM